MSVCVRPGTWQLTTLGAVVEYGKTHKIEPDEIQAQTWLLIEGNPTDQ